MSPRLSHELGRVSILSPVYNEAAHVGEMIESIQAQDYRDWEVVFVDDGSTDDTVAAIEKYQTDPRVKLVPPAGHLGKAQAFNVAFQHSTGEFIALIAGDDRIPPGSLAARLSPLGESNGPALARHRILTFSENPKFHGMTLPRKGGASTSGGAMTMNRALATLLFPIPGALPSEDTWLGYAAPRVAQTTTDTTDIVLEYRIHDGNSNPRQVNFEEMSQKIATRHEAWQYLINSDLPLSVDARRELQQLMRLEQARRKGRVISILKGSGTPLPTRLAMASMAHPALYAIRTRFYRLLSGWRSQ